MKITLDRAGYYRLEVYTRDRSGNKILASSYFWVTGERFYTILLVNSKCAGIESAIEWARKPEVLIVPPGEGTFTFLFSIEGSELQAEVKQISAPEKSLFRFTFLRDGSLCFFSGFSNGKLYSESLSLPLEREKELQIKITPDRRDIQPEEKGKISIQVSDAQGKPKPSVNCRLL